MGPPVPHPVTAWTSAPANFALEYPIEASSTSYLVGH
jgi:hypothetical protein